MKVTTETVTKLVINDVQGLDPIAVYLEDVGKEKGKATITCFNESWSYYWGAMGQDSIRGFLISCDTPYLAGKFAMGLQPDVVDYDATVIKAKRHVCQQRREGALTKDQARCLFEDADQLADEDEQRPELMQTIFGDEWRYDEGSKPNPKYEYVCRIIDTIKEALTAPTPATRQGETMERGG